MGLPAKIAPSILSGDFANLGNDCIRMLSYEADWLHIDIMDGNFVPNLTFGPPVVKALRKVMPDNKSAFFDCHLMVTDPELWLNDLADAKVNQFTFHYEAVENPQPLLEKIRSKGIRAGISIKPGTPVEVLDNLIPFIDCVLIMTVEPGFGGQKFQLPMMEKVKYLRTHYPHLDIEVDGGLAKDTIRVAAEAGANIIVAGTSVFKADDPAAMIKYLRNEVISVQNK